MNYRVLVLSLLAAGGLAAPVAEDSTTQTPQGSDGKLTASVKTTLVEGVEWLVPIEIAGTTFNVQLDTGSGDL